MLKKCILKIFIDENKQKLERELQKINYWHKYLNENYGSIVDKYIDSKLPVSQSDKYKIWVMWWQGLDNMPVVVKVCYSSLLLNSNGNDVILITQDNYKDYINLPVYILEKVDSKIITITHLSDLIRAILLSQYGGLWIDATIYVTSPLPTKIEFSYWTTKWNLSPSEYNKYKLWVGLWHISDIPKLTIAQCMGIWYSSRLNPLFLSLRDFWLEYWKKEVQTPYYWTTELFLVGTIRSKLLNVKQMMDEVPINNSQIFDMVNHINKKFDQAVYKQLLKDTSFFYLSWKEKYFQFDPQTNQVTLFGYLQEQLQYEK